jgi:hypothetical protein
MAILYGRYKCSTVLAVAATMILGGGNNGMRTVPDRLRVSLVKRTSCTQPFSFHHQQYPNNESLTNAREIGVQGQASDCAMRYRSLYRLWTHATRHLSLVIH